MPLLVTNAVATFSTTSGLNTWMEEDIFLFNGIPLLSSFHTPTVVLRCRKL